MSNKNSYEIYFMLYKIFVGRKRAYLYIFLTFYKYS